MERVRDLLLGVINLPFEEKIHKPDELLSSLSKTRVLLIHDAVESFHDVVSSAFIRLYEKAITKEKGIRITLLPRVGKREFIDISESETAEIRRERIFNHLFLRDNLYCLFKEEVNNFPNCAVGDLPSVAGSLSAGCLFPDLESEVEEEFRELTSDIGFKWYLDWCSRELGDGKDISKELREIRTLPTDRLLGLMVNLSEFLRASEGTKFNPMIDKMRGLVSRVLKSRIQGGRRGRPVGREVNLLTEFPEVFEDGGFDLVIIDGTKGRAREVRRMVGSSIDLLKPGGTLFLTLPRTSTYSDGYGELRSLLLPRLRIVSRVEEGVVFLAGREQAHGMVLQSVGDRILTFDNLRERKLVERIIQDSKKTLSDIAILKEGARLRRYTGEEGTVKVIFPENIFNYRLGGPFRYLREEGIEDSVMRKVRDMSRPKVVITRKVEVSSHPQGFLRFFCARDREGYPMSESVMGVIPRSEEADPGIILGLLSSLVFRWLMHRIVFDMDSGTLRLSSGGLGSVPVGEGLGGVAEEVSRVVEELEREFRREKFLELENLILRSYGLELEDMPRSYRELYSSPDAVRF